ncbi:MAG: radical SAM protein [Candidatus Heimdallarchaeota archaeon]|nr:MAG: radical SAM protein [Candidatus Heimdallarchaeota archaeon]
MLSKLIEELRKRPLEELLEEAWMIRKKNFSDFLGIAVPSSKTYKMKHYQNRKNSFVNISITGNDCELNCEHCQRKLLTSMIPAMNSEELIHLGDKLLLKGCKGVLISGGSNEKGSVPLLNHFEGIRYLKERGLKVIVHTGLVSVETAKMLKNAEVDQVLLDIIGSRETIRDVYHLDQEPEVFEKTLRILKDQGLSIAPHIVIGLHFGKILGEYEALRIISEIKPEVIVLVVLSPLEGTAMTNFETPAPEEIARICAIARIINKNTKITFGCAKPPKIKGITEKLIIRAGVNTISFPMDETIDFAKSLSLEVVFKELCCSLI